MALMGDAEARPLDARLLTTDVLQNKYSCPDKGPV